MSNGPEGPGEKGDKVTRPSLLPGHPDEEITIVTRLRMPEEDPVSPAKEETAVVQRDHGGIRPDRAPVDTADTRDSVMATTLVEPPEEQLEKAFRPEKPHLPRPGACVYLMLDLTALQNTPDTDTGTLNAILAEIRLVSNVPDYHLSIDKGWLTIIGTAERAANSLLAMSLSFRKVLLGTRVFLDKGMIEHHRTDDFRLVGSPDDSTKKSWLTRNPDIYLTSDLAEAIQKPGSREGSHCQISVGDTDDDTLFTLANYRPRVSIYTGGPDKLIGYEEPLFKLNRFLRDDDTKLIFLRGQAGIGKSRILGEALATLPSHVLCSLDAADRNIPGASLVTLAEQLADVIQEGDQDFGDMLENGRELHGLITFSKKPEAEKIAFAQRHTKDLADLCFNGLQLTNFIKGRKTLFVLEDLHNADRLSEPHLAEIAKRYTYETDGKALVSLRPEEMYQSQAQEQLGSGIRQFYGADSIHYVELDGLDFSDQNIANTFAFHCIPQERRNGKTVDQIGTWPNILGKAAGNSPFVMTNLMNSILEREGMLSTEGEIIQVDTEFLAELSKVRPEDPQALATHLHQRIANLTPNARIALQAIALAGGRLKSGQIDKIVKKMIGGAIGKKMEVFASLISGGYVKHTKNDGTPDETNIWEFQHELLMPFVISSIIALEDRVTMSRYLYQILGEDQKTHPDVKLALLHNIAIGPNPPDTDDSIWQSYNEATKEALSDAKSHNNMEKIGAIARMILDEEQGSSSVKVALTGLKNGTDVPKPLAEVAACALLAACESALHLGRFDRVEELVEELKKVHGYSPDLIDIDHVNLILFESAYLRRNPKKMTQIYSDYIRNVASIPNATKTIAVIKICFRENRYDDAITLFNKGSGQLKALNDQHKNRNNGMPSPQYVEALRLATTVIPFSKIRTAINRVDDKTTLDSDCTLQPGALTPESRVTLQDEIIPALERIAVIQQQFPTILGPYSELAVLDLKEEIAAVQGRWTDADKLSKEGWRIADQMQVHDQAARYAKARGDHFVTRALTASENSTFSTTDMDLLKEAIAIYSREGMISVGQLKEASFWPLAMRINRIRAVALLALRYQGETDRPVSALRLELGPYLDKAFEDFRLINENHETNAEIAYYLAPFNVIIQTANLLDYPLPKDISDTDKYPFMDPLVIGEGLKFSAKIADKGLNLGEAKLKRRCLYQLFQGVCDLRERRIGKATKPTK